MLTLTRLLYEQSDHGLHCFLSVVSKITVKTIDLSISGRSIVHEVYLYIYTENMVLVCK